MMTKLVLGARFLLQGSVDSEPHSSLARNLLKGYRRISLDRRTTFTCRRNFTVIPCAALAKKALSEEKFRTQIQVKPFEEQLDVSHQVVFLGSCFADYFGNHLSKLKFITEVNPFGIIFNARSMSTALHRLSSTGEGSSPTYLYTAEDLTKVQARWCSFDHHSSFNRRTPEDTLEAINSRLLGGQRALVTADHLVLTLGSAWVYELISEEGRVVANCHKLPAAQFQKRMLGIDEMVESLVDAITTVCAGRQKPPQVMLTVSPVRHWKDGAVENSLSKASLVVAAHTVLERLQALKIPAVYFPAYELLLDDLRDYRFYEEDMLHPNKVARNYIWGHLTEAWFTPQAREMALQVHEIQRAAAHRPFDPDGPDHQRFIKAQKRKISALEKKFSIDLSLELCQLEAAAAPIPAVDPPSIAHTSEPTPPTTTSKPTPSTLAPEPSQLTPNPLSPSTASISRSCDDSQEPNNVQCADQVDQSRMLEKEVYSLVQGRATHPVDQCHLMQFDGGARPNPGPAAGAAVLFSPGFERQEVASASSYIPRGTNNVGEYTGLVEGLRLAREMQITELVVEGDAQLVIRQLLGEYKVRDTELKKHFSEVQQELEHFTYVGVRHVPRAENARADELSTTTIKSKFGTRRRKLQVPKQSRI